ncbi:MAG: BamA/TamA family outer membrane protein [Tunicatimonas sp.]|uniref:translocation and assembly module lipoprotein TamL n=1 Tax=Tunicatimonas sp. TaxID=1940096 RepID=UPI003C767E9F
MTVRPSIYNISLFLVSLLATGCLGTRYLDQGEYLLYEQQIKSAKRVNESELSDFYRQEPNSRLPILPIAPYVWLYQEGQKNYDPEEIEQEAEQVREQYKQKTAKAQSKGKDRKVQRLERKKDEKLAKLEKKKEEGNLFMRWGEPLSVYDSSKAETARRQMESYLHTKGFFEGEVNHEVRVDDRQVTSIYTIIEKEPYRIDSITYLSDDTTILNLVQDKIKGKIVKQNQIYDQDELGRLRESIENLLKNNGYYDFSRQYVEFRVDSTIGKRKVRIYTLVREPAKRGFHKQFELDSIIFTTDADVRGYSGERKVSTFDDVPYRYHRYQYYKKILGRRVLIHRDSLYSREQTLETQRQLSNLDVFKFININYDTTGGKFIANIYASPLKKFQTSTEVGLNVSQGLPGPFVNASLQVRNVFGGLEILELSGRAGIEGVPPVVGEATNSGVFASREAGGNLSLTFPQFILPLPERWKQDLGRLNPKTRLQTGYNYVDRPEYTRTNFQTSMAYTWQKGQKAQYVLTPVDFNFIDSRIKSDTFRTILDNSLETYGIPLNRSFEPSFVTSTSFTATLNFNNYGSTDLLGNQTRGTPSYLRLFLESGGTLLNFFGTEALDDANLAYFKFLKFNPDFRQYISLSRDKTLAYRVNVGVAFPYNRDPEDQVLPYEKYFFAGGSNSIRAWLPRRLGPGSISPDSVGSSGYFVYNLEQPGEVLLEASVEYRQKLFGFVNGALFVDAGNVWRLREFRTDSGINSPRQGSAQFAFNTFIPQIAVGAGAGLRFDFSFLILRFDYGIKIYDPARKVYDRGDEEPTGRWIGQKFDLWDEIANGVLNIGIGYPF